MDKGGHFAAWEQPELFAVEIPRGVPIAAVIREPWTMAPPVPVSRATRGNLGSAHGASHSNLRCEMFLQGEETMRYLGRMHRIVGVAVARAGTIIQGSQAFPPECAHRRTKPFTPFSLDTLLCNVCRVGHRMCRVAWLVELTRLRPNRNISDDSTGEHHDPIRSDPTKQRAGR